MSFGMLHRTSGARVSLPQRMSSLARTLPALLQWSIVPVLLLVMWQVTDFLLLDVATVGPLETVATAFDGLVGSGWMVAPLLDTLRAAAAAFLLAATCGVACGTVLGQAKFWGDVLEGPLGWIYSVPKVVLYPVFLLTFGLTETSIVAFGAIHGFFPLAILLMGAVRTTPTIFKKVAKLYGLNGWKRFWRIIVPYVLAPLVTGLRFCFTLCFIGVVFAEMFMGRQGAGYILLQSLTLHRNDRIFAVALVLAVIATLVNSLFLVSRRVVDGSAPPSGQRM